MGGEIGIYLDTGGDGRRSRAEAARRMLAEREARRAAGLVGPEPSEHPQDKVKRLASEFHARAHAREQAVKMVDVTTGDRFEDRYDID